MSRGLYCTHTFERYFQDGVTRVDRLDQVLRYGILSPREAQKRRLPFKRNLNIKVTGIRDYEDVIFLHTIGTSISPIWPDAITILISPSLEVLTIEEMLVYKKGNWGVLSQGEAYRFGKIDPEYFEEIILPTQDEVEEARVLIRTHLPKDVDRIKLKLPIQFTPPKTII